MDLLTVSVCPSRNMARGSERPGPAGDVARRAPRGTGRPADPAHAMRVSWMARGMASAPARNSVVKLLGAGGPTCPVGISREDVLIGPRTRSRTGGPRS